MSLKASTVGWIIQEALDDCWDRLEDRRIKDGELTPHQLYDLIREAEGSDFAEYYQDWWNEAEGDNGEWD